MRTLFLRLLTAGLLGCSGLLYGQSFVQGDYIEVGFTPCGSFGTDNPVPPGYHNNDLFNGLGVVADLEKDGWDVGEPNAYCGDYFLPGVAVEGFSVQADGMVYTSGNGSNIGAPSPICGFSDFGMDNYGRLTDGGLTALRWNGGTADGWDLRQESVVIRNRLVVLNRITLCNTTGTDAAQVYYQRHTDPDPGQPWGAGFATNNRVTSPGFGSGSAAISTTLFNPTFGGAAPVDCYVAMLTSDARAQGSYGGFNYGTPSEAYNGVAPYETSGNRLADEAIQLTFDLGPVPVGDCACLAWAYVFDRDDAVQSWSATRIACQALDAFARTGDGQTLAETLYGHNATEPDRAFAWQRLPQGFRITDLASGERFQVFNRAGQLVHQGLAGGTQADVLGLSAGLYVVQIFDAQGHPRSGKVLVH